MTVLRPRGGGIDALRRANGYLENPEAAEAMREILSSVDLTTQCVRAINWFTWERSDPFRKSQVERHGSDKLRADSIILRETSEKLTACKKSLNSLADDVFDLAMHRRHLPGCVNAKDVNVAAAQASLAILRLEALTQEMVQAVDLRDGVSDNPAAEIMQSTQKRGTSKNPNRRGRNPSAHKTARWRFAGMLLELFVKTSSGGSDAAFRDFSERSTTRVCKFIKIGIGLPSGK